MELTEHACRRPLPWHVHRLDGADLGNQNHSAIGNMPPAEFAMKSTLNSLPAISSR